MTVAESDESTSPPKTDGAAAACPAPLGERWAHLTYTLGEPLVRKAEPLVAVVSGAVGAARAHARGELAHQLLAAVRQRACDGSAEKETKYLKRQRRGPGDAVTRSA